MSKQALEILPDAGEYAFFYGPKLALLLRSVFDDTVQLLVVFHESQELVPTLFQRAMTGSETDVRSFIPVP